MFLLYTEKVRLGLLRGMCGPAQARGLSQTIDAGVDLARRNTRTLVDTTLPNPHEKESITKKIPIEPNRCRAEPNATHNATENYAYYYNG